MTQKKLLRPERRRQIPAQFSWLDHRLVRDNRLAACEPPALALYLVLVTVADVQGLSYYSEASLARSRTSSGWPFWETTVGLTELLRRYI